MVCPDKTLFFGLLILWLLLFHFLGNSTLSYVNTNSLFGWMSHVYNSEINDESHGFLIPLCGSVSVLVEEGRPDCDPAKELWAPALGLLGLAVILHVAGFVVQQARLSVVALFLGGFAIMGLTWGQGVAEGEFLPLCSVRLLHAIGISDGMDHRALAGRGDGNRRLGGARIC